VWAEAATAPAFNFGVLMVQDCDVVVIGGGIAGASISAHLAKFVSVRLLEMEDQLGYHSTGRSAAIFAEVYGNSMVQALTRASRDFFYTPPADFCSSALVRPRTVLITAQTGQHEALGAFLDRTPPGEMEAISPAEATRLCPILRPDNLIATLLYRHPADIEVHELHQGYLRLLKARGGAVSATAKVVGIERAGSLWHVATAREIIRTGIVVNAAGAWAGEIGRLAGALDIGLQPLKRTVCLLDPPPGQHSDSWPMLVDVDDQFYLKPDAGKLLLSPVDETPSPPCDAQADEIDIAIAVDRIERATTLKIRNVAHKWAGLRTFVRDQSPVVGYDPVQPGFFWLAALGGFGIQTAPALGSLGASMALAMPPDERVLSFGVDPALLLPGRPLMPKVAGRP
jgi:D-arginine dehydrogenase